MFIYNLFNNFLLLSPTVIRKKGSKRNIKQIKIKIKICAYYRYSEYNKIRKLEVY